MTNLEIERVDGAEESPESVMADLRVAMADKLSDDLVGNSVKKLLATAEMVVEINPDYADMVYSIVLQGKLGETEITPLMGRYHISELYEKRMRLLEILQEDKALAETLVNQHIAGFHATKSGSLWGILHHGALLSAAEARLRGQILSTGERTFSPREGQPTISFADWRHRKSIDRYAGKTHPLELSELEKTRKEMIDAAKTLNPSSKNILDTNLMLGADDIQKLVDYVLANPNSKEAELIIENFPIVFGVDIEGLPSCERINWTSEPDSIKTKVIEIAPGDIRGEFLISGKELPLSRVPAVGVPAERIEGVKALFAQHNLQPLVFDIKLVR